MNKIVLDFDTELGFHPSSVMINENGKTLIHMPSDEFLSWLKAQLGLGPAASAFTTLAVRAAEGMGPCRPDEPCGLARRLEENNEGDRPCEDNIRSDSLPETGC